VARQAFVRFLGLVDSGRLGKLVRIVACQGLEGSRVWPPFPNGELGAEQALPVTHGAFLRAHELMFILGAITDRVANGT